MVEWTVQESEPQSTPTPKPGVFGRFQERWRRDLVFFAIAVTVIFFDQLTKAWVRQNLVLGETWDRTFGPIEITHVVNSGAAFGILQGQTLFLVVMAILGLGAILLYYIYPPMDHGLVRIALGLQLGGAIGNLTDRVRFGQVTDFVDVGNFPTFNVADSAISVSIVVVLGFFLFQEFEQRDGDKTEAQRPDQDVSATSND
jgi:signal peptidase II